MLCGFFRTCSLTLSSPSIRILDDVGKGMQTKNVDVGVLSFIYPTTLKCRFAHSPAAGIRRSLWCWRQSEPCLAACPAPLNPCSPPLPLRGRTLRTGSGASARGCWPLQRPSDRWRRHRCIYTLSYDIANSRQDYRYTLFDMEDNNVVVQMTP